MMKWRGGTVTFKYDSFGRRIEKSSSATTSIYAYDGEALIEETNATGSVVARYAQGQDIDESLALLRGTTTDYYDADGLGSITSLTASSGSVAQSYTYDSFGNTTNSTGSLTNFFRYTAREFDTETNLYEYRARYYDSTGGRFLSEDPIQFDGGINFYAYTANDPVGLIDPSGMTPDSLMVNELRLINPQRWNLYSYSINNPITYTDPDGHDAIAVNFAGEVPVGGHEGIIVVHADGSATYAKFGPVHSGTPFDKGKVTVTQLAPVKLGANGLPTDASYKELAEEAGKAEGQPASTVGFNYFKTSEAESIMLSNWIKQFNDANTPDYAVNGTNCAAFCIAGLLKANAIKNENISLIPDRLFQLLSSRANQNYTWQGTTPQKEIVTHCIRHEDGSCQ
jgi:RHS repeat-associated protein